MDDISQAIRTYRGLEQQICTGKSELREQETELTQVTSNLINLLQSEISRREGMLVEAGNLLRAGELREEYFISMIGELHPVNSHILMPRQNTYGLAIEALRDAHASGEALGQPLFTREDGSTVVRPLTFKENIEAKVDDYETTHKPDGSERNKKERLKLFRTWQDSCTGIAYKAKTTKFKLIPISPELVTIDTNFEEPYLPIEYDEVNAPELNSANDTYNTWLGKQESPEHPAWLEALEEDKALLKTYIKIGHHEITKKGGVGFFVIQNANQDELRALAVNDLDDNSNADGDLILNNCDASFLRVAQAPQAQTREK